VTITEKIKNILKLNEKGAKQKLMGPFKNIYFFNQNLMLAIAHLKERLHWRSIAAKTPTTGSNSCQTLLERDSCHFCTYLGSLGITRISRHKSIDCLIA
jgi:hypothetical protein